MTTPNISPETLTNAKAIFRRVEAAISNATARRSLIEEDWPECHRKGCPGRHGNVDSAFGNMKARIIEAVRDELRFELTTRPDVSEDGDTEEQKAVYTLATLMKTYNVHRTSTFVNAAQLMVDAYPALVKVLAAHTVELLVPAGWEGEGDWEAECSCGDRFMVETGSEGELVHRTHVAEVLAAAGYRKIEAGE